MNKQLKRSKTDKILMGVCSGLGEYFGFDVKLIRIIWTLSVIFYGTGLIAYIILAILMPNDWHYI